MKVALALAASLALVVAASTMPRAVVTARYDLKIGDHLVYRETLEREVTTALRTTKARIAFENHVVVTAALADGVCLGVQRNRTSADLISWKDGGRDRTSAERERFREQAARRPTSNAEGNCVALDGTPRLPVSVDREWTSLALVAFHEIEALPQQAIGAGDRWEAPNLIGSRFRAAACGPAAAGCIAIDGTSPFGRTKATYSAASGAVTRFEFNGDYQAPPASRVRETLIFELVDRRRGEPVTAWLGDPSARHAAVAAFSASGTLPVPADSLYAMIDGAAAPDAAQLARQALGLAYRLRVRPPAAEMLARLARSPDARVRALAARFDEERSGPRPGPGASDARRRPPELPGTTLRGATESSIAGRPYVMRVPEDYRGDRPFPLIVYLGGGPGLAMQAAQLLQGAIADTGYLVLYPNADGYWWEGDRPEMVRTLLDQTLSAFNVDLDRVYLAGFSNGGIGALHIGGLWPRTFAAIAASMAALPPDGSRLVGSLRSVPLLLVHGDKDTVIPIREMEAIVREIRRGAPNAPLETRVFAGRGHDIYIGSDEGLTLAFFERHVRR